MCVQPTVKRKARANATRDIDEKQIHYLQGRCTTFTWHISLALQSQIEASRPKKKNVSSYIRAHSLQRMIEVTI